MHISPTNLVRIIIIIKYIIFTTKIYTAIIITGFFSQEFYLIEYTSQKYYKHAINILYECFISINILLSIFFFINTILTFL